MGTHDARSARDRPSNRKSAHTRGPQLKNWEVLAGRPAPTIVNLVVATPCFGGQISVRYATSLFKLQKLLRTYDGVNLKVLFKDGDALITRARASLISQFLDDPTATHLLFIDANGLHPVW